MKTVLVTGVAGFIGSWVAAELISKGYGVVGIDDLSGGFIENVPEGCQFHACSINNAYMINQLVDTLEINAIIHCAAYAAEGLSPHIRRFNYENNLVGSINLINAAVKFDVECFTFLSSIAVHGHAKPPFTEQMIPTPADPYGIAKYAVELDLQAAHELFGLNYVIFRPHNVYGERQNLGDPYRNVIGIFMNQVMSGRDMTVFGDGLQTRAFSYISDVAPAIAASIERPECWNQVINIGGSTPYTVLDLAGQIARQFGSGKVIHLPPRQEAMHAYCDHARASIYFSDTINEVMLSEGIHRMASWAREVGIRPPVKFSNIELHKNLPPSWLKI